MSLNQSINENEEVANQDWPVLNNEKIKSFSIRKNFKRVDIEQTAKNISSDGQYEDNLLSEKLEDDVVVATPNKENSSIVKPELKKVATTPKQEEKAQVRVTNATSSKEVQEKELSKTETKINKETATQTEVVKLQPKNKAEQINGFQFIKLLLLGLGHLYIEKTQNVLKPVKFFKDNFLQVSVALMHFFIPALMTYGLTTQSEFIINSLVSETLAMKVVYFAAFYIFSSFLWITGQVLFVGLLAMIKNSMHDVVKFGQEKI